MSTNSAIPLVTDEVLRLLKDEPELAKATIVDGLAGAEKARFVIAIGGTVPGSWRREYAGMPVRQIKEWFNLSFWIEIRQTGLSQKQSRDLAFEYLAAMDRLFIGELNMGNRHEEVFKVALQPDDFLEVPTTEGLEAHIPGAISCETRFTPKD